MTFALIATIIGAICVALMVITDKLMLSDCYNGKPDHAWFVSSVAGASFGLFLTIVVWFAISLPNETTSLTAILSLSLDLFIWNGLLVMIAGACGVQMLFHYFHCFSEDAHSTSIANWIAATPIFVFTATVLILLINSVFETNHTLGATILIHPLFVVGAIIATVGLVCFEALANQGIKNIGKYRKDLTLMITFNVITIILLQQVLTNVEYEDNSLFVIALLPYYWLGFLAGTRSMLKKCERQSFYENWNNSIRHTLLAVLFVEVIGMLVFFFEYFGLSGLDPTYVSIIFGTHILLVHFFDLALIKVRNKMLNNNQASIKILNILEVNIENLPRERQATRSKVYEWGSIIFIIFGTAICSLYIL